MPALSPVPKTARIKIPLYQSIPAPGVDRRVDRGRRSCHRGGDTSRYIESHQARRARWPEASQPVGEAMNGGAMWARIGIFAANGLLAIASLLFIQPAELPDQRLLGDKSSSSVVASNDERE